MQKAIQSKKTWFFVALFTGIFGVAAIPGIIFSAIGKQFVLMAICIALVVHGFYGSTFYWLAYAGARKSVRLCQAVEEHKILTLADLSLFLGLQEKATLEVLKRSMDQGLIEGYVYKDGALVDIRTMKARSYRYYCPYCRTEYEEEITVCIKCGADVEKTEIEDPV